MGILEKVVVMKLCLFLSMVVLVQSKPGPKPKPEPKPGRWLRTQDLMPRAEAMPTTFNSDSSCVCMTPSHNQINEDPDDMCINKNMCYVDCNSMCRDVQNAVGAGRCFSRRACEGRVLEKCGDYNRPCEDCRYHECQESEKCKWSSWGGNRNDKWRPQGPYGFCKPRDLSPCQQLTPPCQPQEPPPRPIWPQPHPTWPQPHPTWPKPHPTWPQPRPTWPQPHPTWPHPEVTCRCRSAVNSCRKKGSCVVDCNTKCRDLKRGKVAGVCTSRTACIPTHVVPLSGEP